MNISLSGKRVLVTGAGRGLGRGVALRVAACGGHVIAVSRTQANLDSLKAECAAIETVACDLSDWAATRATLEALGPVHGIVNNAGVGLQEPFMEVRPESIDAMFDINLKAVVNASQVVARGMLARGEGGVIVNMSSQASQRPLVDHAVYSASKAALDQLSRVMALELGPQGIRVNCVNPTVVMTDMGRLGWSEPAKAEPMLRAIPLGRFAEVEDVVDAVVFLLSDRAKMINGVRLPVDGGFTAC
ncbi:L-xylulose reductase-like [Pollicipes pollicipes]|uniref:L-xylulose reductase-like n=1 Tax=Pollicipes pollicipes TaxID=41117 RepID=UPI0018851536|nr:L-xylulose reductase-like [Pollicipes pollicipes]XP_037094305.1 L-xylulose reductase-like [Pollicipes pollicipes]